MADDILDKIRNATTYQAQCAAAALQAEEDRSAIEKLRDRLKQEKNDPDLYLQLATLHENCGEWEQETAVIREGLACCPPTSRLYLKAIDTLQSANRIDEARNVARRSAELCPDDQLTFRLKEALLLPILYDTPEEVAHCRQQFAAGMNELLVRLNLDTQSARRQALKAIADHTSFYLAYQGRNDRELETEYGQLVHRIMAASYPEWTRSLDMPTLSGEGKVRVGYVSAYFYGHPVSKHFLGWLVEHDRSSFEVCAYHVGKRVNAVTDEARRATDHFHHIPEDLEGTCRAILAENLHILVFLDIGMDPLMTQLAALRLAPIQCVTWGHPVTSGLPTLDYFLSNELMEPEDGQDHYSERLIRLPGIGICYRKPVIPRPLLNKPRGHFGLGEDRIVCWCRQSIFKYLPQHDDLFARIAKRLPCMQFVFVAKCASVGESFRRRLERSFAVEGIRAEDHCVMLPYLYGVDHWNLYRVSDIFLDSLEFNGGATTLEAIASGLPVVTLPGRFMRGRQGYGILTQLGVTDTIARDKEEYVSIAVRLAGDRGWRDQILKRMKANFPQLYSDTRNVRALEDFYQTKVGERLGISSCSGGP
jgi:predicted O-linked N-acetylglucosamine transferase (SPINDLY family)